MFLGLTSDGVRKYLPISIQTTVGYMHKVRQNIQSTKVVTTKVIMEEDKDKKDPSKDYLPPQKIENRDHIVQITAVKFEDPKGMISSNQTGALLHTSAKGNIYVMVMEDSDAGPILATGIKSRKRTLNYKIHHNL